MRKITLTLLLMLTAWLMATASGFSEERLHYVISYKWGLIHKDAGTATLSLRNRGDVYDISLTARTKPWADRIFNVRDTLLATVVRQGFRPKAYVKIAHEGGKYSRDEISYSYTGNHAKGTCRRFRLRDGKMNTASSVLTSTGPTFDMLSIFYYLRLVDYSSLQKGKAIKATVFSGSKSETVTIRSLGVETVRLRDKSSRKAYHIRFRFTTHGGRQSSDDIDAWISEDSSHIPLLLIGQLPVGQVKCYYVG